MIRQSNSSSVIEEEYKLWRKNIPAFYDIMYTKLLEWQSPSVEWMPDIKQHSDGSVSQKVLLTSYSSGKAQEYLFLGNLTYPDTADTESLIGGAIRFGISQKIPLAWDINKARVCPQSPNIIACKGDEPDIMIFDLTTHPSDDAVGKVDFLLKGHTEGGYALNWNPNAFGELISAGSDNKICHFNINSGLINTYTNHDDVVNDLSFHAFNPNIFISCSDDKSVTLTDVRSSQSGITKFLNAHSASVESLSFSPFKPELFATASSDNLVKIWDTRSPKSSILTLSGHQGSVMAVKWSLHYESILATSSKDRRVIIWDLNRSEVSDTNDSQELMFVHGGHTDAVEDFSWNPCEPMEVCSVSTDNMLHIWKIPIEEF